MRPYFCAKAERDLGSGGGLMAWAVGGEFVMGLGTRVAMVPNISRCELYVR